MGVHADCIDSATLHCSIHSSLLTVSDELTRLHQLQSFAVSGVLLSTTSHAATLNLRVNWTLMHHSQQVRFVGQIVACDEMILQLAQVNLTLLEFDECLPSGPVSMRNMALLAHGVAVHNPNLDFRVDGLTWLQ